MNLRIAGVVVTVTMVIGLGLGYLFFGGKAVAQPEPVVVQRVSATDLKVGGVYEVLRTRLERLPGGKVVRAWYFTGKDRSLRTQYTPVKDGRGRRIMRVVTNDPSLPKGHMRIAMVSEADPSLEGFDYGSYSWEGLVVELNPRQPLRRQGYVPAGGPARR